MNEWFKEFWDNNTGWNRFITTSYYSPSTGEIHLYTLAGLVSVALAVFNFINYMIKQDAIVAIILAVIAFVIGIGGIITSIRSIPYAFRSKSIYKVGVSISGILFSLAGILVSVGTVYTVLVFNKVISPF